MLSKINISTNSSPNWMLLSQAPTLVCMASKWSEAITDYESLAKGLWVAILGRIVRPWKISSIQNAV